MFPSRPRRYLRILTGLLFVVALVLAPTTPAGAHTGFEASSPADGDVVDTVVSEISLTFSGEATPAGEGFVILDPDGSVHIPDETTSTDNLTWVLRFDEPLADGVVGVRWSVAAPDTHPIEGSFSFTITAAAPAKSQTPSTVPTPEEPVADQAGNTVAIDDEPESISLEDFLATAATSARGATLVESWSRVLRLLGAVGAIGGIVFAAFVLRGDPREVRAVLFLIRRAGAVVVVGAVAQAVAQVAIAAQGWSGLWSGSAINATLGSSLGLAIGLRVVAGVLIWFGPRLHTHDAAGTSESIVSVRDLAAVGGGASSESDRVRARDSASDQLVHQGDRAWKLSSSPAAFVGVGLLALSFLFDGHTVSEGPRWVHAMANVIHVMTAATWAGGVVMLAIVLARRHRRNADLRVLQLGTRFSVVAIVGLVGATLAGTALTVVILDSISELWTTSWGRLLILKVLLVALAGIGGAYNHRVILPHLETAPADLETARRFRTVVSLEAAALVAVSIVTALLIAASST